VAPPRVKNTTQNPVLKFRIKVQRKKENGAAVAECVSHYYFLWCGESGELLPAPQSETPKSSRKGERVGAAAAGSAEQPKDKIIAPVWQARPNLASRAQRQTISSQEKQLKQS